MGGPWRSGFLLGSLALGLAGGEVRLGFGVFLLASQGSDVQVTVPLGGSPWTVGLRHVRWLDTAHDPFTGRALSETTEARWGPVVTYRFQPAARGTWYLGGAVYRWEKSEKSLIYGDRDTAATTTLLVGGGYTHTLGRWGFWNTGLYLGPGRSLHTRTSTGSEDDSGVFDIQVQAGVRF